MHPSTRDMLDALASRLREELNPDIRNRIMSARRELLALQAMEE
jgi:hypothetical protein